MPTRTRLLDKRNFVRSPKSPRTRAFCEYLDFIDRLLAERRIVEERLSRSPFSSELEESKRELDRVLSDLAESLKTRYSVESVERDPTFLPVSEFLAQYRPVREPFSILHCSLGMPLHTVHSFLSGCDLEEINAALDEKIPFHWWEPGPHGRPCYLFGQCVWETGPSEAEHSEQGILVLFREIAGKRQQEPVKPSCSYATATATADYIPEKVRIAVWRRTGGRCAECRGHQGVEVEHITPASKGGKPTPGNLQLLCDRCRRQRDGLI